MKPTLTEPVIKNFYFSTLKQSNHQRLDMYNLLFNVGLAVLLSSIVGCILWCMYKGKPDPIQKKERLEKERMYVIGKIQSIQLDKQRARNMLITGLPPEFT